MKRTGSSIIPAAVRVAKSVALFAGVAGSGGAVAAVPSIGVAPESIDVGAISIVPKLSTSTTYDSNVYKVEKNEIDSWVTSVKPSISFNTMDHNGHMYKLLAEHESVFVSTDSADDAERNKVRAEANLVGDIRNRLNLSAEYFDTFEARGDGFLADLLNPERQKAPDELNVTTYSAKYTYGLAIANRIAVWGKQKRTDYDRRTVGGVDVTSSRDRDDTSYGIGLYLKNSMSYGFNVEFERTDVDYIRADLDNQVDRATVGGHWAVTGKTTGRVKVGRASREYDRTDFKDVDSTIWQLGADWTPMSYAKLSLDTKQSVGETTGSGLDTRSTDHTIKYAHGFSDRVLGHVSYTDGETDYAEDSREDDRTAASLGMDFQMRRWLTFGFAAKYADRESNVLGTGANSAVKVLDYDQNQFVLKVDLSL